MKKIMIKSGTKICRYLRVLQTMKENLRLQMSQVKFQRTPLQFVASIFELEELL